ncbi:MAG: hypothetical protein ACI8T1_000520 [Verrucomicrobiales bacterium]|jgi:hypothetical protein
MVGLTRRPHRYRASAIVQPHRRKRHVRPNHWTRLRVPKPEWLEEKRYDRLNTLFWKKGELLRNGVVVWGHIIHANALLFEQGPDNCPAEFVYSLDHAGVDPNRLKEVAPLIARLKDTHPDNSQETEIADYLTHGKVRVFGLGVPPTIAADANYPISTSFITRKHLPKRVLSSGLLPIIVSQVSPQVTLPLPCHYWPDGFTSFYIR